jgi:regulator of sigma E protease
MTILIFFVVLFVLILVHEWGHFIVAKKTGMRVDEFGIGFPPKLFGIKKGETEYTFNLLPIGGFVKIFGEDATDAAHAEKAGDSVSGSFTSKSKWAQTAVLIAGVSMNVLFAWFLFVVVMMMGTLTAIEEGQQSESADLLITEVVSGSPAHQAGVPVGAKVIGFGDGSVDIAPSAFRELTARAEGPVSLTFEAAGEEKTVEIMPQSGIVANDPDRQAVGLALSFVEVVKKPFLTALFDATAMTGNALVAITVGIGSLLADIAVLDADLSQVAGPVGIVGLVGDAAEFGFASLLMFTAIISLNLAVINLLPFPALDGGRLVFVAIEAVRRRPINPVWVARLNTLGFILLMALMFAVTYSDIVKLL